MLEVPEDLSKARREWDEADDKYLEWNWGQLGIFSLAKELKRTPCGVESRAKHLGLQTKRETRGLKAVARYLGYTYPVVLRAVEELGLKVRRAKKMNARKPGKTVMYAFSDEQVEAIETFLGQFSSVKRRMKTTGAKTVKGAWGMGLKPKACVAHGGTDKPHYARGYCSVCYVKMLRETGRTKPR